MKQIKNDNTAVQNQKKVTVYFTCTQILSFGSAEQYIIVLNEQRINWKQQSQTTSQQI